ncbi:DUF2971 domain-containing protein [Aeromonas sp. 1HA1]|uniref:DUF2971 domain-containing protein n=1 Tax=Aeromonas sp. 1HA1 TaxID=2699193 RepID=UPI0023DDB3E4|nr:DUF2971 domain-containing protein [Aeromonas sp. 1HA1]MDF2415655.1 DUF2971 domain-containing protein [Aeromonas sp. 1HA1]
MEILYKYYSKLDINYFLNPTIKISYIRKLNDPFESIVNKNIKNEMLGYDATKERNLGKEIQFYSLLSHVGVVSLTETPRNILMWSHYANEHKGICIGYKTNFLDHHRHKIDSILPAFYRPIKVNYDNIRYDPHTDIFQSENRSQLVKKAILKTLITKGDDWIYEKEHRSIIPLSHHDYIQFNSKTNSFEFYQSQFNEIERINTENGFRFKNLTEVDIQMVNEENDLMFMLSINPESIASIYLGCKSDYIDNCLLYKKIKSHPSLSHINVYQASASRERFELDMTPFVNDLDDYIS